MSGPSTTFEKIIAGEAPPSPIARLLGLRLISAKEGEAVFEMNVDESHWNPMGTLHGGVLCDIADLAMGFAYATRLEEGETFTTIELKINYLRPVRKARLRATARIVKKGRTVGLVECDVTDEKDKLIARASSTCISLSGEKAQGR